MREFDLTAYLPYLLNRAGSRIAAAFTEELREHGITLPMWRVLAAVHHQDGVRIGDLSSLTSIEVSTASRLVGALERKGLADRRRARSGDGDARVVRVHLSTAGHALTERIIPLAKEYEAIALDGFSPAETDQLKEMLVRLFKNMDRLETCGDKTERAA